MSTPLNLSRVFKLLVVVLFFQSVHSQLQVGFYTTSCTLAETIVKDEVQKAFFRDPGVTAGLVRMHFHDCFVRGCDASVLIDSTSSNTAEKDSPANNPSLRGFEVIDKAKARLEAACRGVISCADIVAFAARDSIVLTRGLGYDVPAGRRDSRSSKASDIPGNYLSRHSMSTTSLNFSQTRVSHKKKWLLSLVRAHTIGRSHCTSFSNRLYNFNATTNQDPSLDPAYAAQLKQQCPQGNTNANLVVPMDPASPIVTDASYYAGILKNRGLFTSDQTLLTNPATANQVKHNARIPLLWKKKFSAAMVKMGQLEVLMGNAGEIRANCRAINS
ncbi:hypothetical protein DVH24_031517 [Malus domestica]|uniref:Peroxidase n=1 Tax=Malus domestica TaxID=3750 RepID=A0A498KVY6_MALDO|nr:hypothetical protein DVH24_031517 [Malus domestica]